MNLAYMSCGLAKYRALSEKMPLLRAGFCIAHGVISRLKNAVAAARGSDVESGIHSFDRYHSGNVFDSADDFVEMFFIENFNRNFDQPAVVA